MLNELLLVDRGARQAGIPTVERHPDLKDAGKMPTLLVRLDAIGGVESVRPVPAGVTPWTLRDGQQNSFPFVKPERPLWAFPNGDQDRELIRKKRGDEQRAVVLTATRAGHFNASAHEMWPSTGLLDRLRERRRALAALENSPAEIAPLTFDRFAAAVGHNGAGAERLLQSVAAQLVTGLETSAQIDWLEAAVALLVGKFDKKTNEWVCSGALLFEAAGAAESIYDQEILLQVSKALRQGSSMDQEDESIGTCGLTGERVRLLSGNFQQPTLPILGQTYLFAKNADIPANDRYGRFAAGAMPVGRDVVDRLAGALRALTTPDREGVTWRGIPGESPKQTDLLVAYVEGVLDACVAAPLGEEMADLAVEEGADGPSESIAEFEKRTERLIEAVKGKVGADFRRTPVRVVVFRKVDPANRKVIYAGTLTVASLYDASILWAAGERNAPPWFKLSVFRAGRSVPQLASPPHVAPLGLISFSKQIFLRDGQRPKGKRTEIAGVTAGEAVGLFLGSGATLDDAVQAGVRRVLRMILTRRGSLVWNVAHASRRPSHSAAVLDRQEALRTVTPGGRRLRGTVPVLDRQEALRTVTLLGVLLHKLGRDKGVYLKDTAFKLGQLLAAADIVHAGYCADLRDGRIPPSLLGNQVFPMAQAAPAKALAALSRRWKPYAGWVAKASRDRERATALIASQDKRNRERGWAIREAVWQARDMAQVALELELGFAGFKPNEVFRAELLLGYLAGLPKPEREAEGEAELTTKIEELGG
jgi:hypothetical protein